MKEVASSVHNSSAQELFLKMVSVIWQATEQLFVTQTIKRRVLEDRDFIKLIIVMAPSWTFLSETGIWYLFLCSCFFSQ